MTSATSHPGGAGTALLGNRVLCQEAAPWIGVSRAWLREQCRRGPQRGGPKAWREPGRNGRWWLHQGDLAAWIARPRHGALSADAIAARAVRAAAELVKQARAQVFDEMCRPRRRG